MRLRSFPSLFLCAVALTPGRIAGAQSFPPPPAAERARLAEALRLGDAVRERVWPGWGSAPFPLLLVTDSVEYLVGHPRPSADFRSLGHDAVIGHEILARARIFEPTLLATFPAVGGIPTAVVGTAEGTGKPQWQYSRPGYYAQVAALDLAAGDSTGRWMLDYPFPYDDAPVQTALRRLATALAVPLPAPGDALRHVLAARRALGRALTPPQERYLEFQLWQEGVARYVELAAARAAAEAAEPARDFRALPDYEPYAATAARLERELLSELDSPALPLQRRVAFYPVGAAIARLIAPSLPDWRRRYAVTPLRLDHLLEAAEAR